MRKNLENDLDVLIYRGVPVLLSGGTVPRFFATVGGLTHCGGSWDTLKKKLDAAIVFQPFDALNLTRDGVEEIRVTAADMEESSWIVDKGGDRNGGTRIKFYYTIYPVELRAQLETYHANCAEWDKAEERIKTARSNAREAIEAHAVKRPDGGG